MESIITYNLKIRHIATLQGSKRIQWHQFSSVQSLSRVRLFATPWIAARQVSLSITISRSSLRLMSTGCMKTTSIAHSLWFFLLLLYKCFTMLCCASFWSTTKWISYMNKSIPSLSRLPATPPSQVIPEHWAEIPVLHSSSPLAMARTAGYTGQCCSLNLSQSLLTPQPCPTSASPFSRSASVFLPCKQVHQYHFSSFYIYAHIYAVVLFFPT